MARQTASSHVTGCMNCMILGPVWSRRLVVACGSLGVYVEFPEAASEQHLPRPSRPPNHIHIVVICQQLGGLWIDASKTPKGRRTIPGAADSSDMLVAEDWIKDRCHTRHLVVQALVADRRQAFLSAPGCPLCLADRTVAVNDRSDGK